MDREKVNSLDLELDANAAIERKRERLIPQERKAQIKAVALELFSKQGYSKTSINQICKKAYLSKGGFYHHFASKEELLIEVMKDGAEYRKNLMLATIEKYNYQIDETTILKLFIDKIFDYNIYKDLFCIFLFEIRTCTNKEYKERLLAIYNDIYLYSQKDFMEFSAKNGLNILNSYNKDSWSFFITSLMAGRWLLSDNNIDSSVELVRELVQGSFVKLQEEANDKRKNNSDTKTNNE